MRRPARAPRRRSRQPLEHERAAPRDARARRAGGSGHTRWRAAGCWRWRCGRARRRPGRESADMMARIARSPWRRSSPSATSSTSPEARRSTMVTSSRSRLSTMTDGSSFAGATGAGGRWGATTTEACGRLQVRGLRALPPELVEQRARGVDFVHVVDLELDDLELRSRARRGRLGRGRHPGRRRRRRRADDGMHGARRVDARNVGLFARDRRAADPPDHGDVRRRRRQTRGRRRARGRRRRAWERRARAAPTRPPARTRAAVARTPGSSRASAGASKGRRSSPAPRSAPPSRGPRQHCRQRSAAASRGPSTRMRLARHRCRALRR